MTRSRTLLLGAVVLFLYLGMEWLFTVTKPSFTSMMPPLERLGLLTTGFILVSVPFLAFLALVTVLSERLALGVLAVVLGCLLFLMIDNFLYTVLGWGTLGSPAGFRIVYTALFLALIWLSYRRLRRVKLERARAVYALLAIVFVVSFVVELTAGGNRFAPPESATRERSGAGTPNVVFLGIDGAEANLVSAYGAPYDTTPFLRSVADEWTVFENAFPDTGKTTGSTTALLTGRSPLETHVGFPPQVLLGRHSYLHLPALLNERGYRGFQHAIHYYADAFDLNHRHSFAEVNGRSRLLAPLDDTEWVAWLNDELFFLRTLAERLTKRLRFIVFESDMLNHFLVAQANQGVGYEYDLAAVESFGRFVADTEGPFYAHLHFLSTHCCDHAPRSRAFEPADFEAPDPRHAAQAAARLNALRDVDSLIERVYRTLSDRGLLENTILVVYSDHSYQWDTVWRVPLMVRFPGGDPAGRRSENVLLSGVPGLLAEYLGIERPEWMLPGPGLRGSESASATAVAKPGPPLFGLSSFEYRRFTLGEGGLSRIDDAGPPNYGIGELSMIVCDRWYKASLATRAVTTGRVAGHTAPCSDGSHPPGPEVLERFEETMAEHGLVWAR